MKVLRLVLQAFGPFADRQEIDFRQFGKNPLFLINGPTGAGKSSILDAICFALYGKTATEKREASAMRCDQAEPNTLTEVTLDFELGQKQYRVTRSPQQERPKARGEGITVDNGQASLWEMNMDGSLKLIVARKLLEVTQHIELLSGLNDQQFRQVMVLPQGKFRDLLLADSRDREKIFSQLFQTSIYSRIEERLKQQASSIYNEVKNLQNQIKGLLQGAEVSSEAEILQQLDTLKPELSEALNARSCAHKSHQKSILEQQSAQRLQLQFRTLDGLAADLTAMEQQQSSIKQDQQQLKLAYLAQKLKPGFDEIQRLEQDLAQQKAELAQLQHTRKLAQQAVQDAKQTLAQATKDFAEVDSLKASKNDLLKIESRLQKLSVARQQAAQSSLASQLSLESLKKIRTTLERQIQQREALQKQLEQIRQSVSGLADSKMQLSELKKQLQQHEALDSLQQQHATALQKLQTEQAQQQQIMLSAQASRELASQQESDWHNSQAVSLAQELKQNHPCPVCGSTTHPAPARAGQKQTIISKQQLDQSRLQADAEQTRLQQVNDDVKQLEYHLKQLEHDRQQISENLTVDGSLATPALKASIQQLTSEVDTILQQQQAGISVSEQLDKSKSAIQQLQDQLIEFQQKQEVDHQQSIVDQAALTHLNQEVPPQYQQRADLSQELQQLTVLIETRTEALHAAQAQYDQNKTVYTRLETSLLDTGSAVEVLMDKVSAATDSWQKRLTDSGFDNLQAFQQSLMSEQQIEVLNTRISAFHDLYKELQGRLKQQKKELADQQKPDLAAIEQSLARNEADYLQADQFWNRLNARAVQLTEVQKKLNTLHQQNIQLEQSYAVYGTLSDIASGKTANNVSLQRFVLSVLLDDVLIQATQRLSLMSRGRYLLLRKDQPGKGRGAFGLDLDVEDAYTGKSRSVATLSGGESFMAALALALGLSDVVQAYAGGIKLDMLFIDEGFGSLDQESLELAIRTLMDLQASGRMIGIISHVSELKEQMALRLDVESSYTGSQVKLIAG